MAVSPKKSFSCPITIVTAIPEVNPVVIVNGMNLIRLPKWHSPIRTRKIPARIVASEGEEGHEDDENAFEKKSIWVRMAEVLAGPFMNIVIAFIFSAVSLGLFG